MALLESGNVPSGCMRVWQSASNLSPGDCGNILPSCNAPAPLTHALRHICFAEWEAQRPWLVAAGAAVCALQPAKRPCEAEFGCEMSPSATPAGGQGLQHLLGWQQTTAPDPSKLWLRHEPAGPGNGELVWSGSI